MMYDDLDALRLYHRCGERATGHRPTLITGDTGAGTRAPTGGTAEASEP